MSDIKEIIEMLPQYIQYIYPGYITIYLYLFFRSLSIKDTKGVLLKAIGISYIFVTLLNSMIKPVGKKIIPITPTVSVLNPIFEIIVLIFLAVFSAIALYRFVIGKSSKKILKKLNVQTSLSLNEFDLLQDGDDNIWIRVYTKGTNIAYEGFLKSKETESDRQRFIRLIAYRKFIEAGTNHGNIYLEEYTQNPNEEVIIYYDSIIRIEKRDIQSPFSTEQPPNDVQIEQ